MEEFDKKVFIEIKKPKGINPKQELACHMLAIGMNQVETARQVGATASTIRSWARREDLAFLIKQIQWRIFGKEPKSRFDSLMHAAIDTLKEIMTDSNMKAASRISAAKEVLDRSLGKAEQKHTHSHGSMEDLFEKLDEMNENQKAITVNSGKKDIEDVDFTEIAEQAINEVKNIVPKIETEYDL